MRDLRFSASESGDRPKGRPTHAVKDRLARPLSQDPNEIHETEDGAGNRLGKESRESPDLCCRAHFHKCFMIDFRG
jgi:hypothetical protein